MAKKKYIILSVFTCSFSYALAWFGEDLFQSTENAVEGVASGIEKAANEFGQVVQDGAQVLEDTTGKIEGFVKEGADVVGELALNGAEDAWGGIKAVADSKAFEYTTFAISLALLVVPGAGEMAVAAEALELGADGEMAADAVEGAEAVSDGAQGAEAVSDGAQGAEAVSDGAQGAEAVSDGAQGAEAVSDGAQGAEAVSDGVEGAEVASDAKQGKSFYNLVKSTIKEVKSIPKRIVTQITGDLVRSNVSRETLEGVEDFAEVYDSVDFFKAIRDGVKDKSNGDSTLGAVGETIESYFSPF